MKIRPGALAVLAARWAPSGFARGETAAPSPTALGTEVLPVATTAKSAKRGTAYDLSSPADLQALSPGVSW